MAEINVEKLTKWIETKIVPKVTELLGKSTDKIRYNISLPKNSFFLSYVCFLDLEYGENINDNNKSDEKLSLVIKRLPFDEKLIKKMNMMMQFHNEILFYKKIADGNSRFAKCIYTNEDTIDNSVIITENMSLKGFDVCPETYDIPMEYVLSAIEEIAKFHAMSYTMKETKPEKFKSIIEDIQEARFMPGGWLNDFIDIVSIRSISWLRKNHNDTKFCDKIEKYFNNSFNNITLAAINPIEPLATLCHGDFTRNNIFFKKIDGKLDAMLIDFAVISYSSPVIDLSTFLFLNCSNSDRTSRFNEIFKTYHDTLIENLNKAGIKDLKKYSYENMFEEYKRAAAFGYIVAVYFLPIIRNPNLADLSIVRDDHKEGARRTLLMGGEDLDELFGNMLLELINIGCFDHLK